MELEKEDFKILWNIGNSWEKDPEKAANSSGMSIQECNQIFIRLENIGLIELEFRESKIYGASLTDKGREVVENEEYSDWIPE